MISTRLLTFALAGAACLSTLVYSLGLSCTDHPAYSSGLKGTLIKSWKTLTGPDFASAVYHVNPTSHQYAPLDDEASTKYVGLDIFWAYQTAEDDGEEFMRIEFQRPTKLYMMVPFEYDENYPDVTLAGWKSEEYVRLVKGIDEDIDYGIHQNGTQWVPYEGYTFSKTVDGEVTMPSGEYIQNAISAGKPIDHWILLVAEEDGSAPKYPQKPAGMVEDIVPNQRCPDELHELWVTPNTDTDDPDTDGIKWPTWHPMWDPCYWCAYDHEHGSSPKDLMGYEPKFGYIAFKNGREGEIHEGFKGVVFQEDKYMVYYMMHGQTSNIRRLGVRFHSITLAVKDTETDELVAEIAHKGDFGFISARKDGGGVVPLQKEDEDLMAELEDDDMFRQRTVNVIDEGNLRPDLLFRDPPNLMMGEYEEWTTNPICSGSGFFGSLRMDYTNPISGIKNADDLAGRIDLGRDSDDGFIKNDGVGRIFRASEYRVQEFRCVFRLADIGGGISKDGTFYTNPTGTKLMSGPGPDAIRQFIKPGFDLTLDGNYEAIESWTGMYEKDHEGRMNSYAYSVDPAKN